MPRPLKVGGRPVVVRSVVVGLAHSDHEVVEFLRRAGLALGEDVVDDPVWVEWKGGKRVGRTSTRLPDLERRTSPSTHAL
ncbi:hypothetical protein ACFXMT_11265 [Streptomyces mirabilis]|uniref:hypothetical protein n=1 Tax=Streptomyces mirabilis TaxID=68239 RepID=UPI00368D022E